MADEAHFTPDGEPTFTLRAGMRDAVAVVR